MSTSSPRCGLVPEHALLDDGLLEQVASHRGRRFRRRAPRGRPSPPPATGRRSTSPRRHDHGPGVRRGGQRRERLERVAVARALGPRDWSSTSSIIPTANDYVTRLNQGGPPGLLESDTTLASDDGADVQDRLRAPTSRQASSSSRPDFATRTYYKENVCFDRYRRQQSYNYGALLPRAALHCHAAEPERALRGGEHLVPPYLRPHDRRAPGPGQPETSRYWKVLPFKTDAGQSLEDWLRTLAPNTDPTQRTQIIAEWRDNPFDPHLSPPSVRWPT